MYESSLCLFTWGGNKFLKNIFVCFLSVQHVAKLARPEFKRLLQKDTSIIKERTRKCTMDEQTLCLDS